MKVTKEMRRRLLSKRHRVRSGAMLFDYDYVAIGEEMPLLPVKSLVYTRYRATSTVVETQFHGYKQFQSEIKLDFTGQ